MKQYPAITKTRAQNLRASGLTYREICDQLGEKVPKGTLSYWMKGITLPNSYYLKIAQMGKTNLSFALTKKRETLKIRLETLRNKNKVLITCIDRKVAVLMLSMLYWCEGNKYPSSTQVRFGNSDPNMINLFLTLLRTCYPLDESKFRLTVQCRADQNQTLMTNYWQQVTNIPLPQHYKPRIDARTIGKSTKKKNYYGVCVVDYFDANLQCELQFTGEFLGSNNAIAQMKNQIK